VPNWRAGDEIPLGSRRSLRVVEVREGILVVRRA
jgi:flagellar biogenesis protein FliO